MQSRDFFTIWAPRESVWSRWSKPVAFTYLTAHSAVTPFPPPVVVDWAPPADGTTALIVNRAGIDAVSTGIALAQLGYRPIPLFNACSAPNEIVPMSSLLDRLASATPILQQLSLPALAPPAFLLDANRMRDTSPPNPGDFDNRWLVFAQDFPSGQFLRSQGIQRVVLHTQQTLENDLISVLIPWQQADLKLFLHNSLISEELAPLVVRPQSWLKSLCFRVKTFLFLKRNSAGGFGSTIPNPTSRGMG